MLSGWEIFQQVFSSVIWFHISILVQFTICMSKQTQCQWTGFWNQKQLCVWVLQNDHVVCRKLAIIKHALKTNYPNKNRSGFYFVYDKCFFLDHLKIPMKNPNLSCISVISFEDRRILNPHALKTICIIKGNIKRHETNFFRFWFNSQKKIKNIYGPNTLKDSSLLATPRCLLIWSGKFRLPLTLKGAPHDD